MNLEIKHQPGEHKGSFQALLQGEALGEMTYSLSGEIMIIDHTEADDRLKGMGAGLKMLLAAVAWARAEKLKIVPLCPFAKSVFDKKHSEYEDVLKPGW